MPQYKYKLFVNARFDVVWQKLVDKIEHPEKYVQGIRRVEIVEKHDDHLIRIIEFENEKWERLKEFIVPDKTTGIVVYRLIDHPYFHGETINACRTTNQVYQSEVEYEINWKLNDQNAAESAEEIRNAELALQSAVVEMKRVSEEAESTYA